MHGMLAYSETDMPEPLATQLRRLTRAECILLILIPALYALLINRFRTFNIDNPWFAAFTYSWWNGHSPTDPFMQRSFPDGMGGVEAFGKLAAAIQGVVMNATGWQLTHLELLSLVFVSTSLFFFADTARRMGRSRNFVIAYITLIGLSEQFLFAAEQARYEFLTLLLFSLALWVGTRRFIVFSAFLAALCMEVQPAGCLPFMATVVFLLCLRSDLQDKRGRVLRIAAGTLLAALVYLALHPHIFATLQRVLHSGHGLMRSLPGGFLVGYFLENKRHLAELPFLFAAVVLALRRRRAIFREWAAIAFAIAILMSVLMRWDNSRYVALLMPFVAWFLVDGFSERNWKWIVAGTALIFLPQYTYRAYLSLRHPDFTAAEQDQVAAALDRAAARMGKHTEDLRVRGNDWLWFAHPQHFVALDLRTLPRGIPHFADVVLCFDTPRDPVLGLHSREVTCNGLQHLPPPAETVVLHGIPLHVVDTGGIDLQWDGTAVPWHI